LPVDIKLKIVYTKIVPVMHYNCEVWAFDEAPSIEKVHTFFCRYLLGVSQKSPSCAVLGELGRFKLSSLRLLRAIKYWLRILSLADTRYVKMAYALQYKWLDNDLHSNIWAKQLQDVLLSCGLGEAWYNQGVGNVNAFLKLCKQRFFDIARQQWHTELSDMSRLSLYSHLKFDLSIETYLNSINKPLYIRTLASLRMGNLPIRVNTGRYEHLPKDERTCTYCDDGTIDDEYHLIVKCKFTQSERVQYIQEFSQSDLNSFYKLCCCVDPEQTLKLCKYLYHALRKRGDIV
jgi:hypothetical protein